MFHRYTFLNWTLLQKADILHAKANICTGHRETKVSMHAQDPYNKLIILYNY